MVRAYPGLADDTPSTRLERLAEERGQAMSENLDLVRSIYADWERGDWSSTSWAHPEIEYVMVDEPGSQTHRGLAVLVHATFSCDIACFKWAVYGYRLRSHEASLSLESVGVRRGLGLECGGCRNLARGGSGRHLVAGYRMDHVLCGCRRA